MSKNNRANRKDKKNKKKHRKLPIVGSSNSGIRPCDGCTACCSVFGVEEISKDHWTACPNLNERGCSIYEARPTHCKGFYCLYQSGLGSSQERPDKLGVIFATTNGPTEFTGDLEIQAYEIYPNAFNNPAVVKLAMGFKEKGKLVIGHVFGGGAFRFVGPPDKIVKAMRWNEKADKIEP
jgi:hypothetical protein